MSLSKREQGYGYGKISVETATSDRNLASALAGASLTILTFLLNFLYGRALTGEINTTFFQLTVAVIVVGVYCFGFSAVYYYVLAIRLHHKHRRAMASFRRAEAYFVLGLLLLMLEPALIMLTLRLTLVGVVAAGLFLAFVYLVVATKRSQYAGEKTRRIRFLGS